MSKALYVPFGTFSGCSAGELAAADNLIYRERVPVLLLIVLSCPPQLSETI